MAFDPKAYAAKANQATGFDPKAYAQKYGHTAQDEQGDAAGAALEGFGQGASLGYLAELQALAGKLVPDPNKELDAKMKAAGFDIRQGDDSYVQLRDENVARQKRLATTNPGMYYGGMVAGGIATAPAIEARIAKALPAGAGVVARGAASGAAFGAAANPGSTEGEIAPVQLLERGKNAAIGAVAGAALAKGGQMLSKKPAAAPAASSPTPPGGGLPLIKEKRNAEEIRRAAKALGVDVTDAQLLDDGYLQKLDSLLQQSPTMVGRKHAQVVKEGIQATEKAAEKALAGATDATESQVGARLQSSIVGKIRAEKQPISQLYDTLRESTQHIEVSPHATKAIARNVGKLDQAKFSGPAQSLVKGRMDDILNVKTVDDIKRLRTSIRGSLGPMASSEERSAVAEIERRLRGLEENSIIRAAEKAAKESGSKTVAKDIMRLIDERKVADTQYRQFMTKLEDFSSVIKKGRVGTPEGFAQKIQDMPEEELARRLFSKNNAKGLKFVQEHFPDEAKEIFSLEKSKLLNKHLRDGKVNAPAFLRDVQKYSPEVQEALFGKIGMARLKAAKTYLQSLPPKANPSETTTAAEILSFWKDPISATTMTARDLLIKGVLKSAKALDSPAVERAMNAATVVKETGRKAISTLDDVQRGARAPLIQRGGPDRKVYTGPERRTAEEKPKGESKWAEDGAKKLEEHGAAIKPELKNDHKAKKLLIAASDLKPGSKAMAAIVKKLEAMNG